MKFEDEEKQYQQEMLRRDQNIIKSFLYDPQTDAKVNGAYLDDYSNMNNDYRTQAAMQNQSDSSFNEYTMMVDGMNQVRPMRRWWILNKIHM